MILITGGTGFIGKVLVSMLVEAGHSVRLILRPSRRSPNLPSGVPVEVAISNLSDERSLRAAMVGVDIVYHLAGVEQRGAYGDLMAVDIRGTRAVVSAAQDAGIDRIFYLSHLGVDRSSAYPVMKAKAIAENTIRRSGLDFTIFRTSLVYGENDSFTTGLASLLHFFPLAFFTPGDGSTLIQPLWVDDLAMCMSWALYEENTRRETYELGGPEQLTFNQIMECLMGFLGVHRRLIPIKPPYLRFVTVLLEAAFPGLPVSVFWLDYLAMNHICAIDSVPRLFGLLPSRFSHRLGHLNNMSWRFSLINSLIRRK